MALFPLPRLLHFCGSHPSFAGNDLPFRCYSISTFAAPWQRIKPCRHPGHPVRGESDDHFRDVAKMVGDAVLRSLTVFYDPLNGHEKVPYSPQNDNFLQIVRTVSALFTYRSASIRGITPGRSGPCRALCPGSGRQGTLRTAVASPRGQPGNRPRTGRRAGPRFGSRPW